jgi:hypothetical protein
LRSDKVTVFRTCPLLTLQRTLRRDDEIVYDFCRYTLPGGDLGARSAASVSNDSAASPSKNQQFANGTNHVGGGGAVRRSRRGAAGFF